MRKILTYIHSVLQRNSLHTRTGSWYHQVYNRWPHSCMGRDRSHATGVQVLAIQASHPSLVRQGPFPKHFYMCLKIHNIYTAFILYLNLFSIALTLSHENNNCQNNGGLFRWYNVLCSVAMLLLTLTFCSVVWTSYASAVITWASLGTSTSMLAGEGMTVVCCCHIFRSLDTNYLLHRSWNVTWDSTASYFKLFYMQRQIGAMSYCLHHTAIVILRCHKIGI